MLLPSLVLLVLAPVLEDLFLISDEVASPVEGIDKQPETSECDPLRNQGLCRCSYGATLQRRASWIRWALSPMTKALIGDRKGKDAQGHGREGPVRTQVDTGVTEP